ncbi:MAG TPA: glycosyltransferase family 2 protein [Prolixibacteraceae bacterium]|jgi:glycosyltransferase involved in cell wall biosynthesis|nr:glycosyltransferase family 2 protein [Prolixibacteraceae bacterium]
MKPKVSVVIPFFNAEKTLARAVESILNQTFTDFELLLVNNNSTDNSAKIASHCAVIDKRVVLLNEQRKGVAFAANTGNSAAQGQYIARMDADDVSLPQRLEKQVALLDRKPEVGVVSCLVRHVGHHGNTQGIQRYVDWVNTMVSHNQIEVNRFVEMPLINPTTMFRRQLIDDFGGFVQGDFPEDYELWLRWMGKGVKIEKVEEVLFEWFDSDTRLTRSDKRYSQEAFYRTKSKYLAELMNHQKPGSVWVWGAGRLSRKRVAMLQLQGVEIDGYIDVKDREIENSVCVAYTNFNWNASSFILSYVANHGAREKIRSFLNSKGKIEGFDFLLVA